MSDKALVTVTGASGFIAQHTIRQLLDAGYAVRGTVRDLGRAEDLTAALAKNSNVTRLTFAEADLSHDEGWAAALDGAKYLLHMASPLPTLEPKDENDLIIPARAGALRALKAAVDAGVARIVMTSSIAAVGGGSTKTTPLTEADWSDTTRDIGAYPKSKTLAEKAAWDYINSLPPENRPELVMINPGFVLGPLIAADASASHEVVRRLLAKEVPGIPNIGFNLVDVRDVAAAHVAALTAEAAPGNRYICVSQYFLFKDIAAEVREHVALRGYKVASRQIPDWVVRLLAKFNPALRVVASRLGQNIRFDTSKIKADLNWQPMTLGQSIRETADSLIDHKIV
ncbi:MAG: hypothetical protein COB93_10830 [Sneathiella sp.]|nr:MAG: hypothetical protein COB93_10830 [Sneathiella sp.]